MDMTALRPISAGELEEALRRKIQALSTDTISTEDILARGKLTNILNGLADEGTHYISCELASYLGMGKHVERDPE